MKSKIYITNDTFSALTAFLQKGISQNIKFFIIDEGNLIQNRLWTFSSTAFLPNVLNEDPLLKKTQVPVIVSTKNTQPPEEYTSVFFETKPNNIENTIFFTQNESNGQNFSGQNVDIFTKINNKWERVLS